MSALVLHVITGLTTGGAETVLARLLGATGDARYRSAVVSLGDRGTLGDAIESAGVPVHALGMKGRPGPVGAARLIRLVRRLRPDLVQGWMYQGNLAASLAGRMAPGRPPVVWSVRQSLHDLEREKRSIRGAIRLGARWSSSPARTVYNARAAAEQHHRYGFRDDRTVVIPNGVDCTRFRPDAEAGGALRRDLGIPVDAPVVGMVARFHPVKDHALFVEAAARLARRRPSAHFVLVGPGVTTGQRPLVAALDDAGIGDRVHLLGERPDVSRIMAAFDVATSTSRGEAFPNAVAEAMACGIPCVVTDVGDSGALVGESGRVVPPSDVEALVVGWEEILGLTAEARAALGGFARRRIEEEFTLERMVERYDRLWCGLLQDRPDPVGRG
jgi:glycosyltransferase involved in cell wall biosynthesis